MNYKIFYMHFFFLICINASEVVKDSFENDFIEYQQHDSIKQYLKDYKNLVNPDSISIEVSVNLIADSKFLFDLSKKLWIHNLKIMNINQAKKELLNCYTTTHLNTSIFNAAFDKLYCESFYRLNILKKMKFIPAIFGFLIYGSGGTKYALAISHLHPGYKNLNSDQINLIKFLETYKNKYFSLNYTTLANQLKLTDNELIEILRSFDYEVFRQLQTVFSLYDDLNKACCIIS